MQGHPGDFTVLHGFSWYGPRDHHCFGKFCRLVHMQRSHVLAATLRQVTLMTWEKAR